MNPLYKIRKYLFIRICITGMRELNNRYYQELTKKQAYAIFQYFIVTSQLDKSGYHFM